MENYGLFTIGLLFNKDYDADNLQQDINIFGKSIMNILDVVYDGYEFHLYEDRNSQLEYDIESDCMFSVIYLTCDIKIYDLVDEFFQKIHQETWAKEEMRLSNFEHIYMISDFNFHNNTPYILYTKNKRLH